MNYSKVPAPGRSGGGRSRSALHALVWVFVLAVVGLRRFVGGLWAFARCHDLLDFLDVAYAKGDIRTVLRVDERIDDVAGFRMRRAGQVLAATLAVGWVAFALLPPLLVGGVLFVALVIAGATDPIDDDPPDDLPPVLAADDIVDAEIVHDTAWPLTDAPRVDVRHPVPLGMNYETGAVVGLRLNRHVLVGGITGSGKSELIKSLLAAIALDPAAILHVWSFKSARDYGPFRPVCATFGGGRDPATIAAAVTMLGWLADVELPRRETSGDTTPLIVVLDETQLLFGNHEHGTEARRCVATIAQVGRSAGVFLILATQRPSKTSIPVEIADQLEVRIGLRVHAGNANRLVFGEHAADVGLRADLITAPGVAWVDDGEPVQIRGWLLPTPVIAAVIARASADRPCPPVEVDEYPAIDGRALTAAIAEFEREFGGPVSAVALCPVCSGALPLAAVYCSSRCRTAAWRARGKGQ